MIQRHLIRRLEKSRQLANSTALLYAYFYEIGLRHVENEIRADGRHPRCLEPYPSGSHRLSLKDMVRRLREAEGIDFDVLALRCLKGLDQRLHASRRRDRQSGLVVEGFDAKTYKLCRRQDFLADRLGDTTWQADQSSSYATYARHHMLIPQDPIKGFRIECVSEAEWGSKSLHERLRKLTGLPAVLRVMLWPFQAQLAYKDLEDPESKDEIRFARLCEIENESELNDEVEAALRAAREEEVTILIFPELVVPPGTDRRIREKLRRHGQDGFPILTLYGCCHLPSEDDRSYVNEAPLLGPDGRELHRHRKLTAYTAGRKVGERLAVGEALTVLESRIGNLVSLICLDLPGVPVRRLLEETHGNVVLVPSLSDKTTAHAAIAQALHGSNRAGTFVCNRRFEAQPTPKNPSGTSFFRVPRPSDPYVTHFSKDQAPKPYLLFELDDSNPNQL